MKCDELKEIIFDNMLDGDVDTEQTFYAKVEVDAAIAELKDIIEKNQSAYYVDLGIVANDCEKLKARIHELESMPHTDNSAVIERLSNYNKRLKRALWMARAERAEARKNYWYVRSIHEGDKDLWSIDGSAVKYIGCIKRTNYDWLLTWSDVESKCRAKAEEYK